MRSLLALIIVAVAGLNASAQKPEDILATFNGHTVRFKDLSAETQKLIADVPARTAKFRSDLLGQLINERALAAEAKAAGTTPQQLIASERLKVKDPADAEIQQVIDANRAALAGLTPEEMRKQVVRYLRAEPEQNALVAYLSGLTTKYKATTVKDINSPSLSPADVVATVTGTPVTAKEFEDYAAFELWNAKADIAELISDELRETIYQLLVADEAKATGTEIGRAHV